MMLEFAVVNIVLRHQMEQVLIQEKDALLCGMLQNPLATFQLAV